MSTYSAIMCKTINQLCLNEFFLIHSYFSGHTSFKVQVTPSRVQDVRMHDLILYLYITKHFLSASGTFSASFVRRKHCGGWIYLFPSNNTTLRFENVAISITNKTT
jgi:hypothetical protein